MISAPNEGMFWQGDHIIPVAEGGGESDINNYRTLCTPCHRDVTKQLHQRLKQAKRQKSVVGTGDIRAMFAGAPKAGKKLETEPARKPASNQRPDPSDVIELLD